MGLAGAPLSGAEQRCLESFRDYVRSAYQDEFGVQNESAVTLVAEDWFYCDARHEHCFLELRRRLPEARRILDLASGMGTALLYGLSQGFDGFGIEPDPRKLEYTLERMNAGNMPPEWRNRFHRAVGENLPFRNGSFDAVLSYQTLEHVPDLFAVLREMLRVTKSGGALYLRCPDYRGTFEGHYLLPWLPLLPRRLAEAYLRLLKRPLTGFKGIHYVTRGGIVSALRVIESETSGMRLHIVDLARERFLRRAQEKKLPRWARIYPAWKIFCYFRDLFRRELQMELWVGVEKPL